MLRRAHSGEIQQPDGCIVVRRNASRLVILRCVGAALAAFVSRQQLSLLAVALLPAMRAPSATQAPLARPQHYAGTGRSQRLTLPV
jgi:hypothetical protein